MKLLLITIPACILLSSTTVSAQTVSAQTCRLTLKASKPSARSASLNGVNFSAKQLMALRSACVVEIKHLTKAEKLEQYKMKLEREEADIKAIAGEL